MKGVIISRACTFPCNLCEGTENANIEYSCGAQFCYACGTKWWTCKCPLFPPENLDRAIEDAHRRANADRDEERDRWDRRQRQRPREDYYRDRW